MVSLASPDLDSLLSPSTSSTTFRLVHGPPLWPYHSKNEKLHIAVLDSSFNPPTRAHLEIISSPLPDAILSRSKTASPLLGYTSRLLLFSHKNVDKVLGPGDATPKQRIEMMLLLREEVERRTGQSCAVGICGEPTFVGKSRVIHDYLASSSSSATESAQGNEDITLTFLIGTDTLTRFFNPRYYPPDQMDSQLSAFFAPSPQGDGSVLVSARRGTDREVEDEVLRRDAVKPLAEKGRVRLLDLGDEGMDVSSTMIREAVRSGKSLADLTIPSIEQYVEQQGLYRA